MQGPFEYRPPLRAFQKIGATGNASIQTVGPDIAHALIATAVGLAAAIPAIIYCTAFSQELLGTARLHKLSLVA